MTKDPLLITVSFVTSMYRSEHQSENSKLWRLFDRLEEEIRKVGGDADQELDCYQSSVYAIGAAAKPDNSGRCVICNEWVSAQNKPNIIKGLCVGAEYSGDLFCEEHLPQESPLYAALFPFGRNP